MTGLDQVIERCFSSKKNILKNISALTTKLIYCDQLMRSQKKKISGAKMLTLILLYILDLERIEKIKFTSLLVEWKHEQRDISVESTIYAGKCK